MKFSECFGITKTEKDEWFDPILNVDSKLFIDPFLVYSQSMSGFEGSHDEIISIFNKAYSLIARVSGNKESNFWKKAESILVFREAQEFCIGFASEGNPGSGTGRGFALLMCEAILEAIEAGLENVSHFEEIGILREGIGADRISDITASILRHRFALYTTSICEHYGVPVKKLRYDHGIFDSVYTRWMPLDVSLPVNPFNNVPILLTPAIYLRDLPTISADTFWGYCRDNENEVLRADFNYDLGQSIKKSDIIEFARRHPEIRAKYISSIENQKPDPYDMSKDRNGVIGWYDSSKEYCGNAPITVGFSNEEEFIEVINNILDEFRNYVENNGGWKLLWNDDLTSKREEASQFLMQGVIKFWCQANNIDLSREVNIGRGPVDFKMSTGVQFRSLLELKLARNSRFWNGLTKQLPKYMEAEGVSIGYFVAVLTNEKDSEKMSEIQSIVDEVNAATGYTIKPYFIDATRDKPSASKL